MSSYVAGLIQLNYNVAQFIEPNPKNPKYLQTIRGSGYVLWTE